MNAKIKQNLWAIQCEIAAELKRTKRYANSVQTRDRVHVVAYHKAKLMQQLARELESMNNG